MPELLIELGPLYGKAMDDMCASLWPVWIPYLVAETDCF